MPIYFEKISGIAWKTILYCFAVVFFGEVVTVENEVRQFGLSFSGITTILVCTGFIVLAIINTIWLCLYVFIEREFANFQSFAQEIEVRVVAELKQAFRRNQSNITKIHRLFSMGIPAMCMLIVIISLFYYLKRFWNEFDGLVVFCCT